MSRSHQFPQLDTLRFVFAPYVMFGHLLGFTWLDTNGGLAVDFFFILSGFVLTHQIRVRGYGYPRFATERFARLWPLQVVTALMFLLLVPGRWDMRIVASNILLLQNTSIFPDMTLNGAAWSISAEFIVGLTAFWAIVRYRLYWVAATVVLSSTYALLNYPDNTAFAIQAQAWGPLTYGIVRCALGAALGFVAYDVHAALTQRLEGAKLLPAIQLLLIAGVIVSLAAPVGNGVKVLSIFLGAVMVLSMTIPSPITQAIGHPRLAWMGATLSFGIYMFHIPVIEAFRAAGYLPPFREWRAMVASGLSPSQIALCTVIVAIVVGLAFISHYLIERPSRAWIVGLFWPMPSPPPALPRDQTSPSPVPAGE